MKQKKLTPVTEYSLEWMKERIYAMLCKNPHITLISLQTRVHKQGNADIYAEKQSSMYLKERFGVSQFLDTSHFQNQMRL